MNKENPYVVMALACAKCFNHILNRMVAGGLTPHTSSMLLGVLMGLEFVLETINRESDLNMKYVTVDDLVDRGIIRFSVSKDATSVDTDSEALKVPSSEELDQMLNSFLNRSDSGDGKN